MSRRRRRDVVPTLELVESRQLPSGIIAALAGQATPAHGLAAVHADTSASNPLLNPVGIPTAHEIARRAFRASFAGFYTIGPGRTDAQASQIFLRGVGRARGILHADA